VDELSKGMQQKIQFIATIVHDPDILILDEPFSGLDPLNVALMREYFLDFRSKGKTIIFCTHVLEQAEKLCDEICLMARSRKILEGSMKELKRRYAQDLLRIPSTRRSRVNPGSPARGRRREVHRLARRVTIAGVPGAPWSATGSRPSRRRALSPSMLRPRNGRNPDDRLSE
jgi:ABC-type uncharacterized transport system ATPase subunit